MALSKKTMRNLANLENSQKTGAGGGQDGSKIPFLKINGKKIKAVAGDEEAAPPDEGLGFWDYLKSFLIAIGIPMLITAIIGALAGFSIGQILVSVAMSAIFVSAAIYSIYAFFAPRELFWVGCAEGTARAVMNGVAAGGGVSDLGGFSHFIMSYKGHTFDENWNVVSGKEGLHILPGIRWLGIPGTRHIYRYKFKWTYKNENGKIVDHPEELISQIYIKKYTYMTTLTAAEVGKSMVPVDTQLLITLWVSNPYSALFENEKWLGTLINRIKVPTRDYIGIQEEPSVFITGKGNLGDRLMEEIEGSGDLDWFKDILGITVLKIETPEINLGVFQERAAAVWTETKLGEAEVVKQTKAGEAYKARRFREREADVDYTTAVNAAILQYGDPGLAIRVLTALEKAGEKGNMIIPYSLASDVTKQIVGPGGNTSPEMLAAILRNLPGKTKEGVPVESIKEFKEELVKKAPGKDKGRRRRNQ